MNYPEIDYSVHPAYEPYKTEISYDEQFIAQQINLVDTLDTEFRALVNPSEKEAEDALGQIRNSMNQVLRRVKEQNISILAEEWLQACQDWVISDMRYEFMRRIFSTREPKYSLVSPLHSGQLSALQNDGMYIADFSSEAYEEIRQLSLKYHSQLKSKARTDPSSRAVINVEFNSPLWRAIKGAVKEAGILDVLSAFKKNSMTMLGAGLEYSCSEQNWYQGLYSDVHLDDSPLQYLHIDQGHCLPKSMIYVTAVDVDNGPTHAIPGSNRWQVSEYRIRMHKALDQVIWERYSKLFVNPPYRILARRPELRNIFMQLPQAFRGSSHFGDDILANTALAESLAQQETRYLSQKEQALVFDGPHLLHRGSLVRNGERMSLQVIYRNRNEENIRAHLEKKTFFKEQLSLMRKYSRKIVMKYM